MIFTRLLWTWCLTLCLLQAHVESCPENTGYIDLQGREKGPAYSEERARECVSRLLSIPVEDRTFENFLLPWYFFRVQFLTDTSIDQISFNQALQEKDPQSLLLLAALDMSEKISENSSSSAYQRCLAQNILSENYCEDGLFFVDEEVTATQETEGSWITSTSILNCMLQPYSLNDVDETADEIARTGANVVCVHNLADKKTQYRLYDALRKWYGHFCMGTGADCGIFIASKYDFNKEECGFLDEDREFFEGNILDASNNVGRIIMVRPEQSPPSEHTRSADEEITKQISLDFSLFFRPTLFCENLSSADFLPMVFGSSVAECFDKREDSGEELCCCLLSSPQFSQEEIKIYPATYFRGLLSIISYHCGPGSLENGLPAGFDASGSAGYDSSRGSYAEGSIGYSGDGWSVHAQGDVKRDNSGHTSGGAHVEGTVNW